MKKIALFIIMLAAALTTQAQQKLSYAYDNAGNRVNRTIILGTRSADAATEQADSLFFEETLAERPIKIYPNPVRNQLTIEVPGYESVMEGEYAVFSASGTVIARNRLQGETTLVDMSRQLTGTYVLHIILKGERTVWKVIKH